MCVPRRKAVVSTEVAHFDFVTIRLSRMFDIRGREIFFLSVDFADRTLMESYCIDTLRALLAVPCELCRNLCLSASCAHMAAVASETYVPAPAFFQLTFRKDCSSLLHSTDLAEKYIGFATVWSACDVFLLSEYFVLHIEQA